MRRLGLAPSRSKTQRPPSERSCSVTLRPRPGLALHEPPDQGRALPRPDRRQDRPPAGCTRPPACRRHRSRPLSADGSAIVARQVGTWTDPALRKIVRARTFVFAGGGLETSLYCGRHHLELSSNPLMHKNPSCAPGDRRRGREILLRSAFDIPLPLGFVSFAVRTIVYPALVWRTACSWMPRR